MNVMFDRQTEEARCRLKRYRANVNRINNLLKMPVRINGPSKNVTVKIDDNPGGFIPKSHPDAMSDLQRIVEINSTIASYVLEVNEIENALSVLSKEESLVLIMRDVDEMNMETIAAALGYSSRQSVYNIYKRAVNKFKIALG
ncbi:MAG TPA: hypothetical protein H9954_06140 [Candidatus Phascolarctobacterium stercoravium]|nr:hypothetical protein [Candidatus Phascolarctobacterium stercoravium]